MALKMTKYPHANYVADAVIPYTLAIRTHYTNVQIDLTHKIIAIGQINLHRVKPNSTAHTVVLTHTMMPSVGRNQTRRTPLPRIPLDTVEITIKDPNTMDGLSKLRVLTTDPDQTTGNVATRMTQ